MSKKIACVVTNMFEDSEYSEPARAFEEAGHTVTTIEMEKGKRFKANKVKWKSRLMKASIQ